MQPLEHIRTTINYTAEQAHQCRELINEDVPTSRPANFCIVHVLTERTKSTLRRQAISPIAIDVTVPWSVSLSVFCHVHALCSNGNVTNLRFTA